MRSTETLNLQVDMKTSQTTFSMTPRGQAVLLPGIRSLGRALGGCLLMALLVAAMPALRAADTAKSFNSPEEAVAALTAAVNAKDADALRVIFGPASADIKNNDPVQAANELTAFAAAIKQASRIVRKSETRCVMEVGKEFWPFPIPVVKVSGQWQFDVEAGKEELLNRRIGRNELLALQVMRAYVEAQREYAGRDRDCDEVLEYAQHLRSTPGKKDGLYWSAEIDKEISPLGPLVAEAQAHGYGVKSNGASNAPRSFNGYFFKILTRQGQHAPGGRYDYVINGNMIGGFALVAWPAEYGRSGIMTFIVNQQGCVHQKDLGPKTASSVKSMTSYDPDKTWTLSRD